MKNKVGYMFVAAVLAVGIVLFSTAAAFAYIEVNVMPSGVTSQVNDWDSGPYTWPGNPLELWGNVDYDGSSTLHYTWNFGFGEGSASGTVSTRINIHETHTYSNTGSYVATLTVTDGSETDQDTVFIDVVPYDLEVGKNLAVQRGLKYLYINKYTQTYSGCNVHYWDNNTGVAGTALAVLAFENHGHLKKNDHSADIFADIVEGGLNYLFYYMRTQGASNNAPYDSDINSNGRKIYCISTNMYNVGITTMAIAGTVTPDEVVPDCAYSSILGDTYREVLEDMVDYIAYAQNESYVGGWRYSQNYSSSDNSVSQWPALGLGEAERAPWDIDAPAWVKTRLQSWINYSQYSNGGFGYTYRSEWVNIAKTGAGIIEMVYAGGGGNLTNALNYIASHWGTTSYDYGNIGDHYAMYAAKKGMEYADLQTVGGHDWQQEYNQWYVGHQIDNGTNGVYWPSSVRITNRHLITSFALLVMAPLEACKPVADAGSDQEVVEGVSAGFDGSGSTHTCGEYSIVLYEWDFDYDGVNFDVDATGSATSHAFVITSGTDMQDYTVALRVTDDQSPAKTDTDTLIVTVTNGNVAPVSDPGGPYLGGVGENVMLDGSGSYDENEEFGSNPIYNTAKGKYDEIELYQWDIDGDGLYGSEDSPADPEGSVVTVNFGSIFIGTKTVRLKVTDSFGRNAAQSTNVTTVAVSDLYPTGYENVQTTYNRRTGRWTVAWKVYIHNGGNGVATDVSASLTPTSIPPGVTVLDNAVSWATPDNVIDPGETQLSDDEFRYSYPRSVSGIDLTQITWDIGFTDALGNRHVVRSVPQ